MHALNILERSTSLFDWLWQLYCSDVLCSRDLCPPLTRSSPTASSAQSTPTPSSPESERCSRRRRRRRPRPRWQQPSPRPSRVPELTKAEHELSTKGSPQPCKRSSRSIFQVSHHLNGTTSQLFRLCTNTCIHIGNRESCS